MTNRIEQAARRKLLVGRVNADEGHPTLIPERRAFDAAAYPGSIYGRGRSRTTSSSETSGRLKRAFTA